jgi:hypothetical protein
MSNTKLEVQRQMEISEYLKAKATLKELLSYSNSNRDFEIKMLSDKVKAFESRPNFAKVQAEIEAKHAELFEAKCTELKSKHNRAKTQSNVYPGFYYEVWINGNLYLECTECSADAGNCSCWSC